MVPEAARSRFDPDLTPTRANFAVRLAVGRRLGVPD
jgi:hypothetical protein